MFKTNFMHFLHATFLDGGGIRSDFLVISVTIQNWHYLNPFSSYNNSLWLHEMLFFSLEARMQCELWTAAGKTILPAIMTLLFPIPSFSTKWLGRLRIESSDRRLSSISDQFQLRESSYNAGHFWEYNQP